MGTLVLVRHGESRWNLCNRFSGWVDIPLSEQGVKEAQACATHCARFDFGAAFTSNLGRAHETLLIVLSLQGKTAVVQHADDARYGKWIRTSNKCASGDLPVFATSSLNERFYGSLQGMDKKSAERTYGKDKVFQWRRGFTARPPGGETLQETFKRSQPYVARTVLSRVRRGEQIFVAAHGNTLRAMIKHLEGIDDRAVAYVDLPLAHPIVYHYKRGRFVRTEGELRFDRPLR